jgi:hypothetical protein
MKIKIDIHDVVKSGSVRQAILDYCEESEGVASGVIGQAFATSGPGSGWSQQFGAEDFAARALDVSYGAVSYVDCEDGREATIDQDGDVVWSEDSVICLVVPDEEDALAHPEALAKMAEDLIDYHYATSDRDAWHSLLSSIREAARTIKDLDLSALK